MDDKVSLKETVTHLFDAVRYTESAKEFEGAARKAESELEADLGRLESRAEELTGILSQLKSDPEPTIKEFSRQADEFLATAKSQARSKLEKRAREKVEESHTSASNERGKALKSLEAYLAGDPLPIIENVVTVKLVDGLYHATSSYECEGEMKYTFGLAAQNSKLFGHEFNLAQLGFELRIPVRFSRAILKGRVPGFERLDQYTLAEAETSGGRIRASFQKKDDGAKIKVVTSGGDERGFIGIEYSDQGRQVNVMNDSSLSDYVELDSVRKGMAELVKELADLAGKKVTLLKLSLGGSEDITTVDCYQVLQLVLKVFGAKFRAVLKETKEGPAGSEAAELSLRLVRQRLKLLGALANPVGDALGVRAQG